MPGKSITKSTCIEQRGYSESHNTGGMGFGSSMSSRWFRDSWREMRGKIKKWVWRTFFSSLSSIRKVTAGKPSDIYKLPNCFLAIFVLPHKSPCFQSQSRAINLPGKTMNGGSFRGIVDQRSRSQNNSRVFFRSSSRDIGAEGWQLNCTMETKVIWNMEPLSRQIAADVQQEREREKRGNVPSGTHETASRQFHSLFHGYSLLTFPWCRYFVILLFRSP